MSNNSVKGTEEIKSPPSVVDANTEQLHNEEMKHTKQKHEAGLTPFSPSWNFGLNKKVSVVNLTKPGRPVILYVSSHVGVLYNYKEKSMQILQGHQNEVVSISTDAKGKWVLTADRGDDNVVIVWDSETCIPICTLFINEAIQLICISPDAKYVVTVSGEEALNVGFWLWTYGKDTPDETVTLEELGEVKQIVFCLEDMSQFMLLAENNIVFLKWMTTLDAFIPEFDLHNYNLTAGTYLLGTHLVLTSTTQGNVIVWSDVPYTTAYQADETSNAKNFLKEVKLEYGPITVIKSIDNVVVTGNDKGEIKIYDKHLLLLYTCPDFKLGSITTMNFNICQEKRPALPETPVSDDEEVIKLINYEEKMSPAENIKPLDHSEKGEKLDCSESVKETRCFLSTDMIVFTSVGEVVYVDVSKDASETLLEALHGYVIAMDVDPLRPLICIGTSEGDLYLYDYNTKEMLVHNKIPSTLKINDMETNEIHENIKGISCLKFAPSGFTLACGMENGYLWFLDISLLQPLHKVPYDHVSAAIYKIAFSADSKCLAHIDIGMRAAAYHCEDVVTGHWTFMGKHCAHHKYIVDISFKPPAHGAVATFEEYKLFTLGQDRMLIEYDITNSDGVELVIVKKHKLEQSAIPLCMTWIPMPKLEMFLILSDDEFKYKVYNNEKICIRTVLGPTFGSPVHLVKVLYLMESSEQYLVFACGKILGIQLLPLDGNPYKMMGIVAQHTKIEHILMVNLNGHYAFTTGIHDDCVLMWHIKNKSVNIQSQIGGELLEPYLCLIDGGKTGSLFQELRDFFYYAQILHEGENLRTRRQISDKIPLCEIPDLMRAVGFYPTEEQVADMLNELSYKFMGETGHLDVRIDFEEFVKLYINHRPAFGVPYEIMKQAFNVFSHLNSNDVTVISRENLFQALQTHGEAIPKEQLKTYIKILTSLGEEKYAEEDSEKEKYEDHEDEFSFLPEEISFPNFVNDILGLSEHFQNEANHVLKQT